MLILRILYIGFLICFSQATLAEESLPLIGKWAEKFQNGNMLITEFTATTISSTPADAQGKLLREPHVNTVSYKKLDHSELGDGYAVEFKEKDGKPGGGIMVFVKNPNTILMDFPGMGAHTLTRINP